MRVVAMSWLLCGSAVAVAAPETGGPVVVTSAVASAEEAEYPGYAAVTTEWRNRKGDGWCVGQAAGATLSLTLDRAVALNEIELHSGYSKEKPAKVSITTDRGTVEGAFASGTPWTRVRLDPAPTKKIVIKIVSVEGGPRACLHRLYVRNATNSQVPLLYGVTTARLAGLRATWLEANDALERCDAKALGVVVGFPLEMTVSFHEEDPTTEPRAPIVTKFASAEQLAAACKKEGSVLAMGYRGEGYGGTLESDWDEGRVKGLGKDEVEVGQRWKLAWKGDRWRVTAMDVVDPASELAPLTSTLQQWFARWLLVENPQIFASDARVVILHVKQWGVAAKDAFGYLSISPDDKLGPVTTDAQTLSRDGEAMWMTVVRKVGGKELRGTALAVTSDVGWQIASAFVSYARPNGDANKNAAAGKVPAFEPLPPLAGEASVVEAVRALFAGPLDAVAAKRKDLIALGSGPGEKTVGGAKLAGPWKAAWASKLALGGGVVTMSRTKRSALAVVDAQLDKGKYKLPFRIALVFDRAASGDWTLVHAHFATP